MEVTADISGLRTGHLLLVLCCVVYLIWWSITFNPMHSFPALPKFILFFGIAAFGLSGGYILIKNMCGLPVVCNAISNTAIVLGGVGMYFILLFLTGHFMHRQVTTELFLIVGWAVLELCVLCSVYRAAALPFLPVLILVVILMIAAVIGMICYLAYYQLPEKVAFFDGMVPLILFGVVMLIEAVVIR